ncbi:hypothetical protein NKI13_18555 [Mesorhizobium australicum]|uniref:hypothetical protein n=1 Tax=Mesorhizobium australicum TaxID=536018 RepID=UPI00333CCF9F
MSQFKEVTKEEFFAHVGPLDVVTSLRSPDHTDWELRDRRLVGRSFPGWKNPSEPKRWLLVEAGK